MAWQPNRSLCLFRLVCTSQIDQVVEIQASRSSRTDVNRVSEFVNVNLRKAIGQCFRYCIRGFSELLFQFFGGGFFVCMSVKNF